jgi:mRNA-degrading endonuclease RelE of RelBE toxin-antitoxin system
MDQIEKFLRKLTPKIRTRLITAIEAIADNDVHGIDVVPLKGKKDWFRCRVGDIRIVFFRTGSGTNIVTEVTFRAQAYRRL